MKIYKGLLLLLSLMLSVVRVTEAQTPTTQDCLGAIPVCDFIYIEEQTASGTGAYYEIPNNQVCPGHCMDGEKNSRWYIFTVVESGLLRFVITPQISTDDYDWSVFKLTDHTCGEIWGNPGEMLMSCNAAGGAGYQGNTGVSTPNGGTASCNNGGNTNKWNMDMQVWDGDTYVLVVSDWTQTPGGYTLDFSASTAVIFDDLQPYVEYVGGDLITACGTTELLVRFNENVKCSSVQPGDFVISGPGGPYTVTDVYGYNCDLGGANEREYTLTISPPIYQGGNFNLSLTLFSGISDACNNYAQTATYPFFIELDSPEADAGPDQQVAFGGSATLNGSATGGSGQYSYYWEPSDLLDDPTSQTPTTSALTTSTAFRLLVSDVQSSCQQEDTMWVNVVGGPLSMNVTASASSVCGGDRVDLFANTGGGSGSYTYTWSSNPAGFNSTQQNPSDYPVENTWYYVMVGDGFSVLMDSILVTVFESPVADAGPDQVINAGTTTVLSGSASGGAGTYIYQWEPASWLEQNNIPGPQTLPLYDPTIFTLLITDANGCVSDPSTVLVNPSGDGLSAFPLADPMEICYGLSSTISANATGGGSEYTYSWTSFPVGFTSDQAVITVTPDETTRYDLLVTDQFGNEFTAHTSVTVNQLPVIDLIPDGMPLLGVDTIRACVRDSVVLDAWSELNSPNTEYFWIDENYVNRYYIARTNGSWIDFQTHSVRVTDGQTGCSNTAAVTIMFDFTLCNLDVPERPEVDKPLINLYPNPNQGRFTISFLQHISDPVLTVMDSRGQQVYTLELRGKYDAGMVYPLQLDKLPAGVYVLYVGNDLIRTHTPLVIR